MQPYPATPLPPLYRVSICDRSKRYGGTWITYGRYGAVTRDVAETIVKSIKSIPLCDIHIYPVRQKV